jgi:hypothetical protein
LWSNGFHDAVAVIIIVVLINLVFIGLNDFRSCYSYGNGRLVVSIIQSRFLGSSLWFFVIFFFDCWSPGVVSL